MFSCNKREHKIDNDFRPHIVRHCNKSKIYYYYHNDPNDCVSIEDDLYAPYQHTYKNYVKFIDNEEIKWEE